MQTGCSFCGHRELESRETQYIYRHDGQFLIVDDVPCLQCSYCGEQYFEARVLKGIEKKFDELHVHGSKASKAVQVPVENFLDLQQV